MLVAKEMIRIEGMAFGSLRVRELHGAMWFADAELAQYGRAA
jgi:hypothetical protein